MSESIRDNPNRRLSCAGVAFGDFATTSLMIVAGSNEPLLFLTGDLKIIAASESFCRVFVIDPTGLAGKSLSEIGSGEWGMPKLASLLKATASGSADIAAYELDLDRIGRKRRRLVVNARKLDDVDPADSRLLVAIADVTTAREEAAAKDEVVRERPSCCERCSTASPTVSRLSPAC